VGYTSRPPVRTISAACSISRCWGCVGWIKKYCAMCKGPQRRIQLRPKYVSVRVDHIGGELLELLLAAKQRMVANAARPCGPRPADAARAAGLAHPAIATYELQNPLLRMTVAELYISEGCNCCPPADHRLRALPKHP
jgi:hypothetical protein